MIALEAGAPPDTHIVDHAPAATSSAATAAAPGETAPSLRLAACLSGAAAVLWGVSLLRVRLSRMTDVGLVSVLPVTFYVALACLTVSFCLLVRSPNRRQAALFGHMAGFIVVVHGTPALLYGTLRYAWAWKHVGIVDYIQRHGTVNPSTTYLSAYHNWPGFFAFSALLTQVSGLHSALAIASWAPVFFNLIFAGGLLLVFGSITTDRRIVWFAMWVFYLTNWVGQDYFSPQALNYFIYLVIIGVCLRWLRTERMAPTRAAIAAWQRAALVGLLVLLMAVSASSHQLTPLMILTALAALVLARLCRPRVLPVLMAAMTFGWVVYGAAAFVHGNLHSFVSSLGHLDSNAGSTLINLGRVSRGQALVAHVDRALTAAVVVFAAAGCVLRRLIRGRWDLAAMLLLASPVPLLAVNDYGGEMLFRVYFFALPFAAFFIAALVYPRSRSGSVLLRTVASIVLSCSLLAGLLFAYYGKEQMYHFNHDEVASSEYVYKTAAPGSLVVSITTNYPWAFRNYERYDYVWLGQESPKFRLALLRDPASLIGGILADGRHAAGYLVITDSQIADVTASGLLPAGSVQGIETSLAKSPRFVELFHGPHASVWALRHPSGGNP